MPRIDPRGVSSTQPLVYSKCSPGLSDGCFPTTPGPVPRMEGAGFLTGVYITFFTLKLVFRDKRKRKVGRESLEERKETRFVTGWHDANELEHGVRGRKAHGRRRFVCFEWTRLCGRF